MNCTDIENLLIKRLNDNISASEIVILQEHLDSCRQCQDHGETLLKLKSEMQINSGKKIVPDPAIRKYIMKQMTKGEEGVIKKLWRSVGSIFEYRIPVYQGIIGIAVSIFVLLAAQNLPFIQKQESPNINALEDYQDQSLEQIYVLNDLRVIDHQKIGINVKEDTILTQFIVTTM